MTFRAVLLAVLMVVSLGSGATATTAAAQQAESNAYTGVHVEFETGSNSVSNYAVNDNVIVTNATMQSASEVRNRADIDAGVGIDAIGSIAGAEVESRTETRTSVSVGFSNGGEIRSNDNERGVVQFVAGGEDQFVQVETSSDTEAESVSESRVVVEKDDGTQGTFIVVGEGEVDTNSEGQINAELERGSELAYRQYDDERSDTDEESERMIENGTATAEVYVQQAGEDGQETATNAVEYGSETTVEIQNESESQIEMTVERAQSDGKVVLANVAEEAFDSAEDIEVLVDGEAATRADSYSAVEMSAAEGDEPRYYVSQSASAEATTDVAIGIDHFSERTVTMTSDSTDDGTDDGTTDGSGEETTESSDSDGTSSSDGNGAGFGIFAALVALAGALLAARTR
ncbi:MAG: hypothetical protein ACI8TL_000126 [Natronomonas sp.]|jgi:hypothetical protein